MLALAGVALQVAISVTAPETLVVRQPATIVVRATANGANAPQIRAPSFGPLSATRSEESTQMASDPSGARVVVEHRYLVSAEHVGPAHLAPFEARLGRAIARSAALHFVVLPAPVVTAPAIIARAPIDTSEGVNFHAMVAPDTVYVGQQATYQVGVFLNDEVRYRLRRNPEFIPPEMRAMLSYDLAAPNAGVTRREIRGRRYEVHVFQRALFPLTAGSYQIPPARLNYSLPLSASFFSREESHQLPSETVTLVVRDPPAAGRPADYVGAVGRLTLDAHLDSQQGRVGDPLLLTVRVAGAGNVSFFPRPALRIGWGQAVAAGERVTLD